MTRDTTMDTRERRTPGPRRMRRHAAMMLGAGLLAGIPIPPAVAGTAVATAAATAATAAAARQTAEELPSILAAASRPAFTSRDRETFIRSLGLDAAQAARLEELLAEYDQAFVAGLEAFRAATRQSRPPVDAAATRYREEQAAMRQRMQQVLQTARAEAAEADSPEAAAAIMRAAEEELAELREILTRRLAEFGPGAAEGRANVDAMLARMRELAAEWAVRRDALGEDLLSGVRAMLRPEQDALWPAFERQLTRRTLGLGRLCGEQVDLRRLLEDILPVAEVRNLAAEPLERWERDLDAALRVRNAELPLLEHRLRTLALEAADDPTAADRLRGVAARRVQLHQSVRDITLGAAASIAATLPPGEAARFTDAFHRAAFPSAGGATPLERLVAAAMRREDLGDRPRQELDRLSAAYAAERGAADERIRAATIEREPRDLLTAIAGPTPLEDAAEQAARRAADPDPITAAYRARRELDARYAAAVRSILGSDVFDAMPESRMWRR